MFKRNRKRPAIAAKPQNEEPPPRMDIGTIILKLREYFVNIMRRLPMCVDYIRYKFFDRNDEIILSFHYIHEEDEDWLHICTVNFKNDSNKQYVHEPTVLEEVWTDHYEHVIVCHLDPFFYKELVKKIKENHIACEVGRLKKGMKSLAMLALQETYETVLEQKYTLPYAVLREAQHLNLFHIFKPYLAKSSFYMTL